MFRKVCRLCLSTNDLLWVFDEKLSHNNMTEIIQVTSGVEINKTDAVTQMVCSTCCQITIKMYKFRTTSIKNDKDLKTQCAGYNIAQLATTSSAQPPPLLPQSNIKKSPNMNPPKEPPSLTPAVKSEIKLESKPTIKSSIPMKYRSAHPSIKEVVKKYPNIKLPDDCLKSHVGVYITLLSDEVDEWFYERHMNDADIARLKKEALELTKEKKVPQKRKRSDASEASTSSSSSGAKPPRIRNSNPSKKAKVPDLPPPPKSPTHEIKKIGSVTIVSAKKNVSKVAPSPLSVGVKKLSEVSSDKKLIDSSSNKKPIDSSSTIKPIDSSSTKKAIDSDSTKKPIDSSSTKKTIGSGSTKKPNESNDSVEKAKGERREILLAALLKVPVPEKTPQEKKTEEITLKNLLQSSDKETNRRKQLMPKTTNEGSIEIRRSTEENDSRVEPPEDFEWFTSRPYVVDEQPNKTTFIVSDSDDGSGPADSESSSDKYTFAGALNLAPTSADASNAPDFSLVSHANKAITLYTCKVCDTQHTTLKDLRVHMKRTHTKCPFCKKRFKTSVLRDEHVKSSCPIGPTTSSSPCPIGQTTSSSPCPTGPTPATLPGAIGPTLVTSPSPIDPTPASLPPPIKLKNPKLALVRVDEDEEIKQKYLSAFETERTEKIKETLAENLEPKKITEPQAKIHCQVAYNRETELAVLELEKFLKCEKIVICDDKGNDIEASTSIKKQKSNKSVQVSDDVICISDDEGDQIEPQPPKKDIPPPSSSPKAQIKVVNSEVLRDIDIHANDLVVLQRILKNRSKIKSTLGENGLWVNNPISDGSSTKIKIFKNLRRLLHHYKVPIDVKYCANDISVQYVPTKAPPARKVIDSWERITPIELKKKQIQPQVCLLTQKSLNQPAKFTILNGSNLKSYLKPSNDFKTKTPTVISTPPTTNISSPTKYTILMPSSMLTSVNTPTLPAQQGPLPVIESVTSLPVITEEPSEAIVATLESITNSLMPTSNATTNNNVVVTNTTADKTETTTTSSTETSTTTSEFPSIRVKKLEELVGV